MADLIQLFQNISYKCAPSPEELFNLDIDRPVNYVWLMEQIHDTNEMNTQDEVLRS